MDWCYLDTSFNRITFVVLSAREISWLGAALYLGQYTGWAIG
ncbi:hypothetical protein [Microcoleus sp. S36b_A4]